MHVSYYTFKTPLPELNEVYAIFDLERDKIHITSLRGGLSFTIDTWHKLENEINYILEQYNDSTMEYSIYVVITEILEDLGYKQNWKVEDEMKMECKNCNREIFYNQRYQCYECKCGKVYNAVGNELAPIVQWREEFDEGWDGEY